MRGRMLRIVIVLAVVLAAEPSGRADPQAADRAIAEAKARADAKDFLGAATKYREAYAADPRPELICNVGVAYHKARELPRAHLFLGRCLERGSTLDDRKFIDVVRTTLASLEAAFKTGSYTPVDVLVEPRFATVAIDAFAADETFDGGRTVWLAFGTYRLTVRAEGYRTQTIDVAAKDHAILPVRITLEREPVAVPPARGTDPADPAGPTSSAADRAPTGTTPDGVHASAADAPRSPSLVLPISVSVVTVGLAAVAIIARSQASSHADRASLALRDDGYQSEADSAHTWNTIFGVDLAITGAGVVASAYLWYRVVKAPSRTLAPRVELSGHTASLTLAGQF